MIIVLFLVSLVLIAIGIVMVSKADDYSGWELAGQFLTVFSIICAVVVLTVMITLIATDSNNKVIDEKIAMYQEENAVIEAQIEAVVKQYQEYEAGIFADTTTESVITLVSLYPELKSDTLVQEQINVYIANNNAIKSLKEDAIEASVVRWWLYFGG